MNQPISPQASSLWQLKSDLFWPFEVLSWRPKETDDGAKDLIFRMRLRPGYQADSLLAEEDSSTGLGRDSRQRHINGGKGAPVRSFLWQRLKGEQ